MNHIEIIANAVKLGNLGLSVAGSEYVLDRLYSDRFRRNETNPGGLRCSRPGPHSDHECNGIAQYDSIAVGAVSLVRAATLATWKPGDTLDQINVGWIPGFGPTNEQERLMSDLRASFEGFEKAGIGTLKMPSQRETIETWRNFRDAWDKSDIPSSEISATLSSLTSDADRIRRELGLDRQYQNRGIDATNVPDAPIRAAASVLLGPLGWPFGAKNIDAAASATPGVNWATNPSGGLPTFINQIGDKVKNLPNADFSLSTGAKLAIGGSLFAVGLIGLAAALGKATELAKLAKAAH